MKIILVDTGSRRKFFPLTLTCSVADLRMGIYKIKERWEKVFDAEVFIVTESYLKSKYQSFASGYYLVADPTIILSPDLIAAIKRLKFGEALCDEAGTVLNYCNVDANYLTSIGLTVTIEKNIKVENVKRFDSLSDIINNNDQILRDDFKLERFTGETNQKLLNNSTLYNSNDIFIDEGAKIYSSTLNAETGPIYIGKNALIMEGCHIRGPFSLGEGSVLKMGSKIYGSTSIGRFCTVGGELKNVIIGDFSNKAHDGYLGDSIIGSWCNLGAGTSNSNVKNNASDVRVWNYHDQCFKNVGLKAGVVMGDYSKTAINSSINTGSVIGICCNVFGAGLTPKVIPNFSWGFPNFENYDIEKAITDIEKWMRFKQELFTSEQKAVLRYIFENYNDQNILK